jgi:protein-S-isoprenylcysteine O-methyltransferase Ste14
MRDLNRRALGGLAQLFVVVAAMLFVPPWTLDYWQAWLFLAVFFGAATAVTVDLMRRDPALLARRMRAGPAAEQQPRQRVIQFVAMVAFLAVLLFPAIDRRFGWSTLPPSAVIAGDGLVALGFFVVFLVFRENSFTSATIEIGSGQTVISTGPYAVVRHPMYAGALIMFFGVPLALGSWWGLLTIVPFAAVLAWRLLEEETYLAEHLPGYPDYRRLVRWRLVPFVW